ncbi:MAG: gluconokinase [Chitinispirillaceae bacterium]|nr:gluconokinase [Chitinispirillaceae bacterium]
MTMVIIVMGVSGCGKSTVGAAVAAELGLPFYDADDFHPAANVARMEEGIPLRDEDRYPWLEILAAKITEWNRSGGAVLACSALRESYREILRGDQKAAARFVHLQGSRELIGQRMRQRTGHYMPVGLLESQFAALEPPEDAITISVDQTPEPIVRRILDELKEHDAAV